MTRTSLASNVSAGSRVVIRIRPASSPGHSSSRSATSARSSMTSAHGRLVCASQETKRAAADLEELWPGGTAGRILITTRLPAETFEAKDVRVIPVSGLSRREALSYLSSRLTDHPDQRIEALDLGEDLDGLPLALSQATAVINARQQGCREYRAVLGERRKHMSGVDGASATLLATWSLAAECAHELPPGGLAWPTLVLAAMMDHHGIPGAVMTSPSACSYIAGRPSTAGGADQNMVRAAINNLAAVGLITID